MSPADSRPQRRAKDGWVHCSCGQRHWGLAGAAGLFLWRRRSGRVEVLLQHRAQWSDAGGTWGIPGGAIDEGETPVDGALREAAEEAGVDPAAVAVRASTTVAHPDWSYTTVLAEDIGGVEARATDAESAEITWAPFDQLGKGRFAPLLPAFEELLPALRAAVARLA